MNSKYLVSYAQNREDIILYSFFSSKKKGFYIDVGAGHPINDSVTKLFYDLGWSGINIEPNKDLCVSLNQYRKKDININIGASNAKDKLVFRKYIGEGLSTFSKQRKVELEKENVKDASVYEDIGIEVDTLENILAMHDVNHIDFMKIDVEGYEYEVLMGNDWAKFRPTILCIEANHIVSDWKKFLNNVEYEFLISDGLNEYYVDIREKESIKYDYINSVIGKTIVPYKIYDSIIMNDDLTEQLQNAKDRILYLEIESDIAQQNISKISYENEELRHFINLQKRLRTQIKNIFSTLDSIIQMNINKLNNPHKIKRDTISVKLEDISIDEVKEKIQNYDMKRFYNSKNGITIHESILYRLVNTLYHSIKNISKWFLLLIWRMVKKIKKLLRRI